ncbi:MAG: alpha/beta hydrolase [Acidimicrobiia bacterium]
MTYDEFGLFHENAEEWGIPFDAPPVVRREYVEVAPGRRLSALVWGTDEPELVLLHGGAQNAHTWDTVALALGHPLIAVDLPGHGYSGPRPESPFAPRAFAADVDVVVRALAPNAQVLVGMSLGGATAMVMGAHYPGNFRQMVLVDATPAFDPVKAAPIGEFVRGPEHFDSFDEILERTMRFNPTRSESSLRRGVLHNAVERPDGTWVWRHQQHWAPPPAGGASEPPPIPDFESLWEDVEHSKIPILLVRGTAPGTLVDEVGLTGLARRRPDAQVVAVDGAGHSVQGDKPLVLAGILRDLF